MGTVAPGRVFGNLRDLVRFDVPPLGSAGGPRAARPYVVVRRRLATILPPTHRPTGRLPRSLCRYSAGYSRAYNYAFFDSNNAANNVRNNDWNDFANNSRYSDGLRLRFRSRFSAGFSCRRTCRRSALHSERYSGRYFLTNNGRYFERHSAAFAASLQFAGCSLQDSSPRPSPQRGEGERSGGEDGARLRREFPVATYQFPVRRVWDTITRENRGQSHEALASNSARYSPHLGGTVPVSRSCPAPECSLIPTSSSGRRGRAKRW